MTTTPLSQSQLSLFLACQGLDPQNGNYQLALLYKLPESIDLQKLKKALEAFVAAHPAVFSHVQDQDGTPCMVCSPEPWKAEIKEIDSIDEVKGSFARPMDLYKDRLFRLELYKTLTANYFYCDFHHIIADGTSLLLFQECLNAAYQGQGYAKEVPQRNLDALVRLRKEGYRVILLSNTNPCMMAWAMSTAFDGKGHALDYYFDA